MVLALVLFGIVLAKVVLFDFSLYKILSQYYKRPGDQTSELKATVIPNTLIQISFTNPLQVLEALKIFYAHRDARKFFVQLIDDSLQEPNEELSNFIFDNAAFCCVVPRFTREGFKAGALQAGLDDLPPSIKHKMFEFVAVFDQDFYFTVEWFRHVYPYFKETTGCVQTHWTYRNRFINGVTTTAGIMLDAHFRIEKQVNKHLGLPNIFNGSAGIWRWECLSDCGEWRPESAKNILSAEDLDLSARALSRDWHIVYAPIPCNSLLPITYKAFEQQQMRWCFGATQHAFGLGKIYTYWFDMYAARFFLALLSLTIFYFGYWKLFILGCFFAIPCLSTLPYWLMAEDTETPTWSGVFYLLFYNYRLVVPCTYSIFRALFKRQAVWEL